MPTSQLTSVASQWQALDEYVAKKAYVAVFGYQTFPKFTSTRINFGAAIFHAAVRLGLHVDRAERLMQSTVGGAPPAPPTVLH